jgi:nucleotide-binding universal stress UspA family protein
MAYRHLVVHLDGGERTAERLDLAVRLAGRFGARLTGLFAEGGDVGVGKGHAPAPQDWRGALERARAAFDARTRAARVETSWWRVGDGELEVGGIAARYCRYADLAIIGQHDPDAPRVPHDFAEIVVVESGRPVLVVPYIGRYPDLGRRVLVAWDGSREAARALNDALPLIAGAERVQVAELHGPGGARPEDPDGPSVIRHLAAHGITAEREPVLVETRPKDATDALDAILNLGADLGADLVVMGARGRSGVPFPRVSERTRASLASMTAPVLFSI